MGHKWEEKISNRFHGRKCPFCSGKRLVVGENDLGTVRPDLAEDWDFEKNAPLLPENCTSKTHKKVWWRCKEGHSWESTIANRFYGNNCPHCSGFYPIIGKTDLNTVNPQLAEEWAHEENDPLIPQQFTTKSGKKVWWKCKVCGNKWQSTIQSRSEGGNCPYCAGRIPIVGLNDLATRHPELIEEWDFEKNTSILPEKCTMHSHKKVWWKCREGHTWQATIDNRVKGHQCPRCQYIEK